MAEMIIDGKGSGKRAEVNSDNQLVSAAVSQSIQHWLSRFKEQAYQVIGTANLAAGTIAALHIKNIATDKLLTVTYIRHQVIDLAGGTALPNASNYFIIALGRLRVSGGAEIAPVNVNEGSGLEAMVEAYQGNPTLTGTAKEIDRWYTKAEGDMNTFSKEGAVIVQPGRGLELSYVGDQAAGILYTRLSFLMVEM
jgi:hypothetical protein